MSYRSALFLHIPKTGGTTLRSIITRQYRANECFEIVNPINESVIAFRETPAARRLSYRMLHGHMSFGMHQFMSDDFAYITMLREPLRRAVSDFAFVSTNTLHPLYPTVREMNFSEYLKSGLTSQLENGQTRLIAGDCEVGDVGIPTVAPIREADYELAAANLDRYFRVVGLLERFDESLMLMRQHLGWKLPFYARENVTAKGAKPRLTTSDLATARQNNYYDLLLYTKALSRLDLEIAAGGESFQRSLSRFRLLNRAWATSQSLTPGSLRPRLGRLRRRLRERF